MIVAAVPRRDDHGRRDAIWRHVAARWRQSHPEIPVREFWHHRGPFNRSLAINRSLGMSPWTVAVVMDADSFCPPPNIEAAVQACLLEPERIWFPHDRYRYLSEEATLCLLAGANLTTDQLLAGTEWTLHGTSSSVLVIHRKLWDAVGGFDEGFVGWGFEDVAFRLACETLGAPSARLAGDVFHMRHPVSPENDETSPHWQAGKRRLAAYEAAAGDERLMRFWLATRP